MLMWFRRDLRVDDVPALRAAAAATVGDRVGVGVGDGDGVVPLFVLDPVLLARAGANRHAFLLRSLRALRDEGVPLVIRTGSPAEVVPLVAAELGVDAVYCTADTTPFGRRRDLAVHNALVQRGCRLVRLGSPYAVDPGTVRKDDGSPLKVFTPFHRRWLTFIDAAVPQPSETVTWRGDVPTESIPPDPSGAAGGLAEAGPRAAWQRWERFRDAHLDSYGSGRNRPDLDATSRLSVDLKFGALHPRQLLADLHDAPPKSGRWVFRSELAWREFYADVLWHRPDTVSTDFADTLTTMEIDTGESADERFQAWCEGRTGFPLIDAGMRQLLAEGWMHNRVRMATASFLVKDLHLDWRRGARWFMDHLVDGDIASNQHGWQWVAGTGTDASPYYRIFNPTTQGRTHDPDGTYIRRYVSELTQFEGDVHEPTSTKPRVRPGTLFDASDTVEAHDYPPPIVDHAVERKEALRRLTEARIPRI